MRTTLFFVIFLVLTLLLCTGGVFAQEPDTLWTRAYGGSQWEDAYDVTTTFDGGFAFVGSTASLGAGGYDVHLVKVDADGDTLWTRAFGGSGEDKGRGIDETSDHGLIAVGCTKSFGDIGGDVYMIRTNATGDTLWTKVFDEGVSDGAWDVKQTTDGGYAVVGYANDPYYNRTDLYFLKTDSSGENGWSRTYGWTNRDHGYSVEELPGGGYILGGNQYNFDLDQAYMVRIAANGDLMWDRDYGGGGTDYGVCATATTDGGFALVGTSGSFGPGGYAVYLVRTDADGDTLWTRTYGTTSQDFGNWVDQTVDGGFIIVGSTRINGGHDLYIVKTDVAGDTLWTKIYGFPSHDDIGRCVVEIAEDEYIISGEAECTGPGTYWDAYLWRLGISSAGTEGELGRTEFHLSPAYPNPAPGALRLVLELPEAKHVRGSIHDVHGRRIITTFNDFVEPGAHILSWTGTDPTGRRVAPGIYYYRIDAGGNTLARRMVLMP